MRLAVSALSAASGLILLGLALFGRPDAYLREARRQWTMLWQTEPAGGDEPVAAQVQALQEQVMQLRDQIAAARQAEPPEPLRADAVPAAPEPVAPQAAIPEPETVKPAPAGPVSVAPDPAAAVPPAAPRPAERAERPAPLAVMTTSPERRDIVKPASPPRPRQDTSTAKPDADVTEAVLARLRQHIAPPAAPVSAAPPNVPRPSDAPMPEAPRSDPSRPDPSRADPSHERLAMARAALLNGAVAEAVRLLQQVQLQLVFRPVTPDNNEPGVAGQGAADVARALAALGAGDPRRGLIFIEHAMSDLSGANTAWQPPQPPPPGGYAPAYPSR